jgi:hypothetical protein
MTPDKSATQVTAHLIQSRRHGLSFRGLTAMCISRSDVTDQYIDGAFHAGHMAKVATRYKFIQGIGRGVHHR